MKRTAFFAVGSLLLSTQALGATFTEKADALVSDVKKALVVYENKDSFVRKVKFSWLEQFQVAAVQPNGSNGLHLKKGASPVNQEFRRSWLGVTADFKGDFTFRTWVRLGGLPERETYANGFTKRNFTYTSLFELWVKKNFSSVKGLSVQVGKIKSLFTLDYSMPSSTIYCIERSLISNQFAQDSNWGIDVTYAPDKQNKIYLQLMANDRASATKSVTNTDNYHNGRGFKGEFGWEDRCFAILGAAHKFHVTESGYHELSAQYMHDFDNAYHGKHKPGANYFGLGFQDAASLGYEYKRHRFLFQSNLVSAFEQEPGKGTNNIGLELQPIFSLTPHVDLVLRYTGMTGHGACKLASDRYICTQTTAASWVDSIHAFYLGANLYLSAKDKNAAKLMFGIEYTTARDDGADCYNGWSFLTAARWSF